MIYPHDLRLGSTYMSTKFEIPVSCEVEDFCQLYQECDGAKLDPIIIEKIFKPIRLTERVLVNNLRFKFKEKKEGTLGVYSNGKINLTLSHSGNVYHVHRALPYIHTLQNYYYDLHRTELLYKRSVL